MKRSRLDRGIEKRTSSGESQVPGENDFGGNIMFDKGKYITRGVADKVPLSLQLLMWQMIDSLPVTKDHLQVFRLVPKDLKLHIVHSQEKPPYKTELDIAISRDDLSVSADLFVIDDGDHSTMLCTEEY